MSDNNTLTPLYHFTSPVYVIEKPEFLEPVRRISMNYLAKRKDDKELPALNPMYPAQTAGFFHEPELKDFTGFIAECAWAILEEQGHDVKNLATYFQEMWCQEHQKWNGHEEHIHNHGAHITGFYFIDAPAGGCQVMIHDPRPGRMQIILPEANLNKITIASSKVLFNPKPGSMYFINSWLPHSVTRNPIDDPTRLVHFNLGVKPSSNVSQPTLNTKSSAVVL
jgi:uncharacterized protein (TIGR02466 family)